jgi:hypothetical protein
VTIHNDTNKNRVSKLQEIMGLLRKSITSNNASNEEVWELLKPAIDDMSVLVGAKAKQPEQAQPVEAPAAAETRKSTDTTNTHEIVCNRCGNGYNRQNALNTWTLGEIAAQAPLEDLGGAMTTIVNRFEEALETK